MQIDVSARDSERLICKCEAVTPAELRACIKRGAFTVEVVGLRCGAGTGCGSCRGAIEDAISREARRRTKAAGRGRRRQLNLFDVAGT